MKLRAILKQLLSKGAIAALGITAIAACSNSAFSSETASNIGTKANKEEIKFICREGYNADSGEYLPTTYAWTPRGKIAVIRFKTGTFIGSGYTPEKRCREISPRFDAAYKNGSINSITNGEMNNQPVICTAREYRGECDTLLMTLRPEDDGEKILYELANTLNGRRLGGTVHSSYGKQYYYEVDINRFLRTTPVEEE